MPYTATSAPGGSKLAATALAGTIQAIGPNRGWINAPGAGFLTLASTITRLGDVARIVGSTSNDADWLVRHVIDDDNLILAGTFTTEAAAGTVEIVTGAYNMDIVDEATPSWGAILLDTTQIVGMGTGVVTGDAMEIALVPPATNPKTLYKHAFDAITIDFTAPGGTFDWVSASEFVINVIEAEPRGLTIRPPFPGSGNVDVENCRIEIGALANAADDESSTSSSVWAGYSMSPTTFNGTDIHIPHFVHASMITNHTPLDGGNLAQVGVNGQFNNSIFNGGLLLFALPNDPGTGQINTDTIKNPIIACPLGSPAFTGLSATNDINEIDNVTISNNGPQGITLQPGGVIQGLLSSGEVNFPLQFFDFPAPGIITDSRNQRGELTLFETFNAMPNVLDYGLITYTFEPIFAYRNENDETFIPVANLNVEIRELEDSYILQFPNPDPQPAGDYTVTILGTDYTYNAAAAQNAVNVSLGLSAAVNAAPEVAAGVAQVDNSGPPGALLPNSAGVWITKLTDYQDLDIQIASPANNMEFVDNETSSTMYTTAADGTINGGVPIVLRKGLTSFSQARGDTQYTIAICVEGADITPQENYIVLDFKYQAVWPVELASPNWDGELDALG